jgi:arsenical pump membrane protein
VPEVGLLAAAVAMLLLGHRWIPTWAAVAGPVLLGFVTGIIGRGDFTDAVEQLDTSLAFLLVAVPLAVLLGEVGFFDAAAERVAIGHRLVPALWVFAALVTTVLNLDAAIVLLTPLYIRIARLHAIDPVRLAFQPVLLASLASSALPVSNLTNLIVADRIGASTLDFLWRLGPASLLATIAGWFAFERLPGGNDPQVADETLLPIAGAEERRALLIGAPAVGVLLIGFVFGGALGIEPWMTAAAVALALVAVTGRVPWRTLPIEAAAVAGGLGVLAAAAAPHLGLDRLLSGTGLGAAARASLVGLVGADAVNNLPALLLGLPHLDEPAVWGYLAGVNFGPVLWASGSLAGLLWLDIVRREGLQVSFMDYARVGVRVGIPALLAATPWVLFAASR